MKFGNIVTVWVKCSSISFNSWSRKTCLFQKRILLIIYRVRTWFYVWVSFNQLHVTHKVIINGHKSISSERIHVNFLGNVHVDFKNIINWTEHKTSNWKLLLRSDESTVNWLQCRYATLQIERSSFECFPLNYSIVLNVCTRIVMGLE